MIALSITTGACEPLPGELEQDVEQNELSGWGQPYFYPLLPGPYRVGSKTMYVTDADRRFDEWGEVYGSASYKDLLDTLEDVGEPRTLVTEVWYPVYPGGTQGYRRATYLDYYEGDRTIFARRGVSPYLLTSSGQTVEELALADPQRYGDLRSEVLAEQADRQRDSFIDAPIAAGRFPLIVLSHGGSIGELGNSAHREVWTSYGEHLASHGYVVVAMNHTGDSRHSMVLHNPDSPYAQQASQQDIDAAYEIMFTEAGVPDKLFGLLAAPGGDAFVVNEMFMKLFHQRVDDVATVIDHMKQLNHSSSSLFKGHIKASRIGMAGFSLGSMTTQSALDALPDVDAGMSWNNGMPYAWEPCGFEGVDKPNLFSFGTEDRLTRTFFTELPYFIYPSMVQGGLPSDFLQLPAEQVFPPTAQNREPVVHSAFERAQGPKALVEIEDGRHWDVIDSEDYLFPLHKLQSGELEVGFNPVQRRLPLGADVTDPNFVGDEFTILGWKRLGNTSYRYYLPHVIRNYYSAAWFGLHLKRDSRYQQDLCNDPFESTHLAEQDVCM